MRPMMRTPNLLGHLVCWLLVSICCLASAEQQECEVLKASLTYTQEKAPRDLSSVLPVVVEKVNRVLSGVVDVEVEWTGAELHGRVGQHFVKSTVTRLASAVAGSDNPQEQDADGREVTKQCFHVPFTILDTNECTLPTGHVMKHKCPKPSVCVNTNGSYDCLCPDLAAGSQNTPLFARQGFWEKLDASQRSPWELSFSSSSRSSCPGSAHTHGCCPEGAHSSEGSKCRERFRCPSDPCAAANECASNAECVRAGNPTDIPSYTCECPDGLMGNGRSCQPSDPKPAPKVMFDGVTPTELTVKNNYYCGCTKPVVDACSGFPPCAGKHEICTVGAGNKPECACKPGYILHEEYGCVDQNPPTLKLRNDPKGDKTLRLKQGDDYREHMVDIVDDNAEDYLRSLKVSYSQPLPQGCLTQVGEFHVNYTVAMPWAKVPYVRETRRVVIEDINECTLDVNAYGRSCPMLVPQCDTAAGAKCFNTYGSYECRCPSQSTGDGFLSTANFGDHPAPDSYNGGTSCVDTSKPVITLQGPNPKVFKICECGGLNGIMSPRQNGRSEDKELNDEQRTLYGADIREMIRATAGAELCASSSNPNPQPSDCVTAIDHTYKGQVDLSDRVVIGEPVKKSDLQWDVPYNVVDDAGNEAITIWREVVVQEVDLASVESILREEITREKEAEQRAAIDKAIRAEKAKWERANANTSRSKRTNAAKTCPVCPACDCPDTPVTNSETCQNYCENLSKTCALSDDSFVYSILFWMEDYLSPSIAPIIILVVLLFFGFLILRFLLTTIYNPRVYQSRRYMNYGQANDEMILRTQQQQQAVPARSPLPPPRESMSTMVVSNGTNGNQNTYGSNGGVAPSPGFTSPSGRSSAPGFASPSGFTTTPAFSSPSPGFTSPPQPSYTDPTFRTAHPNRDRPSEPIYDESIYMSPPIINPSKKGEGARRRNLYT